MLDKGIKTFLISFITLLFLYINLNFMVWLSGDLYSFSWFLHTLTILSLIYLLVKATDSLYLRISWEKEVFAEGIKRNNKTSITSRLLSFLRENSKELIKGASILFIIFVGQIVITFSVTTYLLLDFIEVMFYQTVIILSLILIFSGKGGLHVSGGMEINPFTLGGIAYAIVFFILLYQGI